MIDALIDAMTPDLYGPSHKAARLALCDMLVLVGRADAADPAAWAGVDAAWADVVRLVDGQSRNEAAHLHPMIRIAAPAVGARLEAQHAAIDAAASALTAALAGLCDARYDEMRGFAARAVRAAFQSFMNDYMQHVMDESMSAAPALTACFAPPALFAAEKAMRTSAAPGEALVDMPIIARALAQKERFGLTLKALDSGSPAFLRDVCRIMDEATDRIAAAALATSARQAA